MELIDGSLITGPPKSEAGKCIVTMPAFLLPEVASHLDKFTGPETNSLVFAGPKNAPLRRSNFNPHLAAATGSAGRSKGRAIGAHDAGSADDTCTPMLQALI